VWSCESNKIINVFAEARKVAAALPGAFAECGERGGAVAGGRAEDSISPFATGFMEFQCNNRKPCYQGIRLAFMVAACKLGSLFSHAEK
jgi:hypothetical protein